MGAEFPALEILFFFKVQLLSCQASTWITDIMANNRIYHIMEEW